MKRKKLIEQLKKLRTLAERGAAQRMFDTLCQTHGITPDELADVREVRFFDVKTDYDRKLLVQIVCSVLDSQDFDVWKQGQKRNKRGFALTDAEYVKIDRLYRILRADFQKQVEKTYRAFVEANKIYPPTVRGEQAELTQTEYDELLHIVKMSEIMTKCRVNAEIGGEGMNAQFSLFVCIVVVTACTPYLMR